MALYTPWKNQGKWTATFVPSVQICEEISRSTAMQTTYLSYISYHMLRAGTLKVLQRTGENIVSAGIILSFNPSVMWKKKFKTSSIKYRKPSWIYRLLAQCLELMIISIKRNLLFVFRFNHRWICKVFPNTYNK